MAEQNPQPFCGSKSDVNYLLYLLLNRALACKIETKRLSIVFARVKCLPRLKSEPRPITFLFVLIKCVDTKKRLIFHVLAHVKERRYLSLIFSIFLSGRKKMVFNFFGYCEK